MLATRRQRRFSDSAFAFSTFNHGAKLMQFFNFSPCFFLTREHKGEFNHATKLETLAYSASFSSDEESPFIGFQ